MILETGDSRRFGRKLDWKNSTEGFRESGKGRLRALCSLAVGFPPERDLVHIPELLDCAVHILEVTLVLVPRARL